MYRGQHFLISKLKFLDEPKESQERQKPDASNGPVIFSRDYVL